MTLYQELTAAGIETDNHASDLYCPATPEAYAILKRHPQQYGSASVFTSQTDGRQWYDVPFAFDPYWQQKITTAAE